MQNREKMYNEHKLEYYLYIIYRQQCFGSGRIRIILPDPDPDPLRETLIRILVAKKIVINSHKNQPKLRIQFLKKKSLILFNIPGSGSSDPDPDPHQNEADPKH